eukprot:TRINITY_DN26773_c0_g1_i1.p1 TRINITY_DN26773_c0_g1~~TRINITY_DN26773_c0_g1_i1.p1  ORF type:complete len:105 (-),score=11.44 TRINITY_DN26773_c0_g1_i1:20-304(-)
MSTTVFVAKSLAGPFHKTNIKNNSNFRELALQLSPLLGSGEINELVCNDVVINSNSGGSISDHWSLWDGEGETQEQWTGCTIYVSFKGRDGDVV